MITRAVIFIILVSSFAYSSEPKKKSLLEGNWCGTASVEIVEGMHMYTPFRTQAIYNLSIVDDKFTFDADEAINKARKNLNLDDGAGLKQKYHFDGCEPLQLKLDRPDGKKPRCYLYRTDGDNLKLTQCRENCEEFPKKLYPFHKDNKETLVCFIFRKERTETAAEVKIRTASADAQRKAIAGTWTLTHAEWAKPDQKKPDTADFAPADAIQTLTFDNKHATSSTIVDGAFAPIHKLLGRSLVEPLSAYEFGFEPTEWLTIHRFEPQDVLHPEPCRFRYKLDGDTLTLAHEPEYPDFYPASLKAAEATDSTRLVLTYTRTKK